MIDPSVMRRRAEARLAVETPPPAGAAAGPMDTEPSRLLHELQVHQIELEMQNDELIASHRELELLQQRYQAMFEVAPVSYLTISPDGGVLELNEQALKMLGGRRRASLERPMRDHFIEGSREAFDALLGAAAASGGTEVADNLLLQRSPGVPMYVRAQARRLAASAQQPEVVLLALMDVTALKYAMDDISAVIQERSLPKG